MYPHAQESELEFAVIAGVPIAQYPLHDGFCTSPSGIVWLQLEYFCGTGFDAPHFCAYTNSAVVYLSQCLTLHQLWGILDMLLDEFNRHCNSHDLNAIFHEIGLSFVHTIDLIEDIVAYRCLTYPTIIEENPLLKKFCEQPGNYFKSACYPPQR